MIKKAINSLKRGWLLLFLAGIGYVPGGILLIIQSWSPTLGPYSVGEVYPYGGVLQAWQVSNGFGFIAFGIMFCGMVIIANKSDKIKLIWIMLLLGYIVIWFPHLWLGIQFIASNSSLGIWIKYMPLIIVWMIYSGLGFYLTWKDFKLKELQNK